MPPTAVDTSVVVAGLLTWHERHPEASAALEAVIESGSMVLPAPALVEAYSVMTRLPAPHRLDAKDAQALLVGNFHGAARVVALESTALWPALQSWSDMNIIGGRAYDAHILACARRGGARRLLTFNVRDFAALDVQDVDIREP